MESPTSAERAIEILAVIHLATIGLSHLVQPRAWARFFVLLREKGDAGVFAIAFLSLSFGSIVVSFHNVWTGLPVVLTLLGWAQVGKGFLYFVAPRRGMKWLAHVSEDRPLMFVFPGLFLLALAGVIGFHLVRGAL